MTLGSRKSLYIHAVLQRQCCEKMPHIVEPHMLRSYCFQNFIVGPSEGVWIVHCPGFRQREHIRISRVLFVLFDQKVHRLLRDRQRPDGVWCLRRTDYQFPFDTVNLFCNRDRSGFGIQVRPEEVQQFSPSQARRQFQIKCCQPSVKSCVS